MMMTSKKISASRAAVFFVCQSQTGREQKQKQKTKTKKR
jgi:hypothetical protein